MNSSDLTFLVDYEEILLSLAVQPPDWSELNSRFESLLVGVTNPDYLAICYRNMGLVLIKQKFHNQGMVILRKGLSLVTNAIIKLQLLLIINLLGGKEAWQEHYSLLVAKPPIGGSEKYARALTEEFRRIKRQGTVGHDIDYVFFLSAHL